MFRQIHLCSYLSVVIYRHIYFPRQLVGEWIPYHIPVDKSSVQKNTISCKNYDCNCTVTHPSKLQLLPKAISDCHDCHALSESNRLKPIKLSLEFLGNHTSPSGRSQWDFFQPVIAMLRMLCARHSGLESSSASVATRHWSSTDLQSLFVFVQLAKAQGAEKHDAFDMTIPGARWAPVQVLDLCVRISDTDMSENMWEIVSEETEKLSEDMLGRHVKVWQYIHLRANTPCRPHPFYSGFHLGFL